MSTYSTSHRQSLARRERQPWLVLMAFLAACLGVAAVCAAILNSNSGAWYQNLVKPSWSPPAWALGPIWAVMFGLMGVAAWVVWKDDRSHSNERRVALAAFYTQLALTAGWVWLFFGLHMARTSVLAVSLVAIAIEVTALWFARISRTAGLLMLPCVAWTLVAVVMNLGVAVLN